VPDLVGDEWLEFEVANVGRVIDLETVRGRY
jgi:hypothetical protein